MSKRTIQHVIWDWNGTILDDVDACVDAANRMLSPRRLPPLTRRRYLEIFGFPVRSYYDELGFDFSVEAWDALAREFHDNYEVTSRDARLREDVTHVLRELQARGISQSILSASEISILRNMLVQRGLDGLFDEIWGLSDLYAGSKIDLGKALLARLDTPPRHILMVGDTVHDFEVATELGCACVLVSGGHQSDARLAGCNCPLVRTQIELLRHLVPAGDTPPRA